MRSRVSRIRRVSRPALPLALVLLAAGCGLKRPSEPVFAPGGAVLFGHVTRDGAPLAGQLVKLYDEAAILLHDSLRTDAAGRYGFERAPAGGVMVKASSLDPLDFSYVRFIFTRGSSAERDSVPPMDLRAHGCAPSSPPEGTSLPTPDPGTPLTFRWSPMSAGSNLRYKVRLADAADSTVWESSYGGGTLATFNGIGTGGAYAGRLVPPGDYSWRINVRLPDDVSAGTHRRAITFTGGGR